MEGCEPLTGTSWQCCVRALLSEARERRVEDARTSTTARLLHGDQGSVGDRPAKEGMSNPGRAASRCPSYAPVVFTSTLKCELPVLLWVALREGRAALGPASDTERRYLKPQLKFSLGNTS